MDHLILWRSFVLSVFFERSVVRDPPEICSSLTCQILLTLCRFLGAAVICAFVLFEQGGSDQAAGARPCDRGHQAQDSKGGHDQEAARLQTGGALHFGDVF